MILPLTALLLSAAPASAPVPTSTPLDAAATANEVVSALSRTESLADADIVSEIRTSSEGPTGDYRVGLVLGPARPLRARDSIGHFIEPSKPRPDQAFVGVVLREGRTKRFVPAATINVDLDFEEGRNIQLEEMTGPYPIYGRNVAVPPGRMKSITVTILPPAYHRHAEMLSRMVASATVKFELKPAGSRPPFYSVVDPKPPAPIASDWHLGDDLRQALAESRVVTRVGDLVLGFVVEGPEPIWLWKGGEGEKTIPVPVVPSDTNHLEAVVIHAPSGLNVTSARARYIFGRIPPGSSTPETHEYLLNPLLADFYHYGLTTDVPAGAWNVLLLVEPPRHASWAMVASEPEDKVVAIFSFERTESVGNAEQAALTRQALGFADRINAAAARYQRGEHPGAAKDLSDAFFDFEGSELDAKLLATSPADYKEVEARWIEIRAKMQADRRPGDISVEADWVARRLVQLASSSGSNTTDTGEGLVGSFVVLLREGLEAILVLSLLVAVLKRSGRSASLRLVWRGAVLGLAASIVLAVLGATLWKSFRGVAGEAFEGVTELLAMAVLFFTSFWLISRVEGRKWAAFVKGQLEQALAQERGTAVASLAFLVVFREGAETVLIYLGLLSGGARVGPVIAGIGLAAIALVLVFVLVIVIGARVPVRPFFAVCGGLLLILCFKFAGDGVHELQAASWVGLRPVHWVQDSVWLKGWLGIYPTLQTVLAQGLVLLAVLGGLAWTVVGGRRSALPGEARA